jgi:hypothetical protein
MMRWLLGACALVAVLVTADARASVSIAVTWDGLLRESTAAAIVSPIESRAVWENGRIYTYTHVRVERPIAGDLAAGGDAWVRTMGGVVGKVGQMVDGEPVLAPGQSSLLFLHPVPGESITYDVTARGQGQFPLVPDEKGAPRKVIRSMAAGALLSPRPGGARAGLPLAAEVLHGRPIDDVARDVAAAWAGAHAAAK